MEFGVPHIRHIDGCVGLHGERAPDFLWHVRLEAFFKQFREVDQVACGREDGIEHDLPGGAVIGVIDTVSCEESLRITSHKNIGFVPADLADNVAAQVQVRDEVAIGVGHDMNRLGTNDLCRGILFFVADGAQIVGRHFGVSRWVKAFVTTGEEHIGDVMSLTCPFGQRAAAEEFRVVGMRKDDEDVFWGVPGFRGYQVSGSKYQV